MEVSSWNDEFLQELEEMMGAGRLAWEVACSFPWRLHPDAESLKGMLEGWILSPFGTSDDNKNNHVAVANTEKVVRSGFGMQACLVYANGLSSRMAPIVQFMTWLFIVDDLMDDPDKMGALPDAATEVATGLTRALLQKRVDDSGIVTRSAEHHAPIIASLVAAAADWWSPMRRDMSPAQQARFLAALGDYLDASRRKVDYRSAGSLPDVAAFEVIREASGAWRPFAVLLEYSLGIELSSRALSHPLFEALHHAASFHMYWVNDLLSFRKEWLEGDTLNLILQHQAPTAIYD